MKTKFRYKLDDHFVICDVCGKRFYASQIKIRWDGAVVCPLDWEPKHPALQPDLKIREGRPVKPVQKEQIEYIDVATPVGHDD